MEAQFQPYGPSHLAALAVLVAGIALVAVVGRRSTRRFERRFAVTIVALAVPLQLLQFTPAEWDLDTSLPLQLCDWAWVVAAIALWTRWRLAATIIYLWGLTLSIQGFLTPELETPFPELRWWMFWAMHLLIVWSAFHVVVGMRVKPTWRTYGQTVAITLGWLVAALVFNLAAGTNYGYLNRKPEQTTALDFLGPWPWYVVLEIIVVVVIWALLVWPWTVVRKLVEEGPGSVGDDVGPAPAPVVGGDEVVGDEEAEREK